MPSPSPSREANNSQPSSKQEQSLDLFMPMKELPADLQYQKGSHLLPPKYAYGWVINQEEAVEKARRLGLLLYQDDDEIDPVVEAVRAEFREEDEDIPESTNVEQPKLIPDDEKEIDIYYTISGLISHLVRPTGARLADGSYLRNVVYKRRRELAVTLYDNYYTGEKYKDWEIEAVRNVHGAATVAA